MNNKTITAQERKNRSIEILQTQNVPFIEHLPLRYETNEVIPRDKKEVIERIACSFTSIYPLAKMNILRRIESI